MTPMWTDHLADADRRATELARIRCTSTDPAHLRWTFRHFADVVHAARILTVGADTAATTDLHDHATRLGDMLASAHVDDESRLGNASSNAQGIGELEDFDALLAVSTAIEAATPHAPDRRGLLPAIIDLTGAMAVLASGDYDDGQELADHIVEVCRKLAAATNPGASG